MTTVIEDLNHALRSLCVAITPCDLPEWQTEAYLKQVALPRLGDALLRAMKEEDPDLMALIRMYGLGIGPGGVPCKTGNTMHNTGKSVWLVIGQMMHELMRQP